MSFLSKASEEDGVKVLGKLLAIQLNSRTDPTRPADTDNRSHSGEGGFPTVTYASGTALEEIQFRRPERPRRRTAMTPDTTNIVQCESPDTQDGSDKVTETLMVNPDWLRDQDHIDNLESQLHQALARIEVSEAELRNSEVSLHCRLSTLRPIP